MGMAIDGIEFCWGFKNLGILVVKEERNLMGISKPCQTLLVIHHQYRQDDVGNIQLISTLTPSLYIHTNSLCYAMLCYAMLSRYARKICSVCMYKGYK